MLAKNYSINGLKLIAQLKKTKTKKTKQNKTKKNWIGTGIENIQIDIVSRK